MCHCQTGPLLPPNPSPSLLQIRESIKSLFPDRDCFTLVCLVAV